MTRFSKFIFIIIMSCVFVRCAYYAPTVHNIPLFHKKGEARIAGGISFPPIFDEEVFAADVYGAYALTDHLGLLANTNILWGSNSEDDALGFLVEVGSGYYKSFHEHWVFEAYGLIGHGYQTHDYTTAGSAKINAFKYSMQPSIGYTSKHFDLALSSRFSLLHFYSYNPTDFSLMDADVADELAYLAANRLSVLFEPAVTLRAGWEQAKFQLQVGSSTNLNHRGLSQTNGFFHFGVIFYLD